MKSIAIIGSSIAGVSLALLLGKDVKVTVYESKPRKEIGKKLCSNICTEAINPILKNWGLVPERFILRKFTKQKILTRNKSITFPIKEYELSRTKLIEALIFRAQKNGAKFKFETSLVDFGKSADGKGFDISFMTKNGKKIFSRADVLVGADGVLSLVAKKAGLADDKKYFLYLQTNVSKKEVNKKFIPGENAQNVFVGGEFGYYSYIHPSGKGLSVGLGDDVHKDVKSSFENFTRFLGIKKFKLRGALIPIPKVVGKKGDIFVIGDAASQTKFSLGGIIPSMMAAESLRDVILNEDYYKYFLLKIRMFIHQLATHVLRKLDEEDYEELFEIMKDDKFKGLMASRDKFGWKELGILMSPKLVWFSLKNLLK